MKISVIGSGYVGLVTAACFADLGNDVVGIDIDANKVSRLNNGDIPIFEPGLEEMVKRGLNEKRLRFTTSYDVQDTLVDFIAVGTPMGEDHRADLQFVKNVAKSIGESITNYKVVVTKSTVPVGTNKIVKKIIGGLTDVEFDIASNPEFLREGAAIKDFMVPDRIVIGVESENAKTVMSDLYEGISRANQPIMFTDVSSAEIIKYASNAMLATRISYMNMLAPLCELTGADVKDVAKGMGLDNRIGPRFLQAGIGYGGSCFPKDINALIMTLIDNGFDASILQAVDKINYDQRKVILPRVEQLLGDIKNKTIGVWGIAFKPKTDDVRDAPSIDIIKELQCNGASIIAFDPEAQENAKSYLSDVRYVNTPYEAITGVDCLVINTEWNEFRNLDKNKMLSLMNSPNIVDGRNIYDPAKMNNAGFNYLGIGR